MASLFGRKYMRGKPGPVEKTVGLAALVLLGGIVVVFLLTGGLLRDFVDAHPALARVRQSFGITETPLFVADRANFPAPSPPHELRVARSMLPETLAALDRGEVSALPLRSPGEVQAAQAAGVDPELAGVLDAHKARHVYLAAYGQKQARSVMVQIADLGEPKSAQAACRARTPKEGRSITLGRGGWVGRDGAVLGFWAGRYYTEMAALNPAAPPLESLARTVASTQLAYGAPPVAAVATSSPDPGKSESREDGRGKGFPHQQSFPHQQPGAARFAVVPGGKLVPPTRYDRYAENMYEKIDGKESAFRAYEVVDLKFAQYAEPDERQTYDVYIYNMAVPVNAMGMYISERVEKAAALPIGREGYTSGTSVFFWKGQYYVNVMGPPDRGDASLGASKQIASAIAETIADDGQPFWAEAVLPNEHRVAGSLSYQASSALGYEFLNRVFFAKYEVSGKTLQLFLARAADPGAAASMFARFAESTARYDKVLSRDKLERGELMLSESPLPGKPSRFAAAFSKGLYFGGVTQSEHRAMVAQQARALFDKLSADDPGDPGAAAATKPAKPQANHGEPTSEPSEGSESGH